MMLTDSPQRIWCVPFFFLKNKAKIKSQVHNQPYCPFALAAMNSGSSWPQGGGIIKVLVVADAVSPPTFRDIKLPLLAIHC